MLIPKGTKILLRRSDCITVLVPKPLYEYPTSSGRSNVPGKIEVCLPSDIVVTLDEDFDGTCLGSLRS